MMLGLSRKLNESVIVRGNTGAAVLTLVRSDDGEAVFNYHSLSGKLASRELGVTRETPVELQVGTEQFTLVLSKLAASKARIGLDAPPSVSFVRAEAAEPRL